MSNPKSPNLKKAKNSSDKIAQLISEFETWVYTENKRFNRSESHATASTDPNTSATFRKIIPGGLVKSGPWNNTEPKVSMMARDNMLE